MTAFRSPATRLLGGALLLAASGLLAGCGDGNSTEKNTSNSKGASTAVASENKGVVTIDDQAFTFVTDMCMVADGDVLVSGPGTDDGGDPVYVSLDATSSTEGGIDINLGTDDESASSDETLTAGSHGGDFSVETDGSKVTVNGDFAGTDGSPIGAGTMEVTCS